MRASLFFAFSFQFAGAVLRHMHRMSGGWKAEEIEDRLIIRKNPKGNKRVERIIVSVEGLNKGILFMNCALLPL